MKINNFKLNEENGTKLDKTCSQDQNLQTSEPLKVIGRWVTQYANTVYLQYIMYNQEIRISKLDVVLFLFINVECRMI